jgi:membrane-associated phospholipid phosphatase
VKHPEAGGPLERGWKAFSAAEEAEGNWLWNRYPKTVMLAIGLSFGTAVLFTLMAVPWTARGIQAGDGAILRFMVRSDVPPLTWLGLAFNVIGGAWVTGPVRVITGLFLAVKRRWWLLATLLVAVVSSALFLTIAKRAYDRSRPSGSLVATTGSSFPSGHAAAATVTALILVVVLVAPGRGRFWWWLGAIAFTLLMAASRAYLRAHWMSDAIGGVLLGSACALDSALLLQALSDRLAIRSARRSDEGP